MGSGNTSYTEFNVSPGHHTYCVAAFYEQEEESVRSCQNITVDGNPNKYLPIKNLQATPDGNSVELKWKSPLESDWMFLTDEYKRIVSYSGVENFSAIVRLTVDDLKYYIDSKLSQVRFYLYEMDCKHTIQIWHLANPFNTITTTPLISQSVENKATGVTVIDLDSPLTIESGKELWIGINYELNPMSPVATIDNGPTISEKNLVLLDDEFYFLHPNDDFNWYIAGFLQLDDNHIGSGIKYAVYRNVNGINVWQNDVTSLSYLDKVVPSGSHIYCVSAAYGERRTDRSEFVCVQAVVENEAGILALYPSLEMNVYPNPIRQGDVLMIDAGNDFVNAKLSLYSVSGQLLREAVISKPVHNQTINLPPGIYILQIRKDTQVTNRKIVVN
jgi:hypothetical protein